MAADQVRNSGRIVLIVGSAPAALACRDWPRAPFTDVVAINNAWAVRPDWDFLVHPEDFAPNRLPDDVAPDQRVVTHHDYVPIQNRYGGFVFAGGTMAFTAGYWALGALSPDVLAFFGCDMVYPDNGPTHFYGTGTADPLRKDVTLRNLEAKSARLHQMAAHQGCHAVNLSASPSRLDLPRATTADLARLPGRAPAFDEDSSGQAEAAERRLGYFVASGRYWQHEASFDTAELDRIDRMWLAAKRAALRSDRELAETAAPGCPGAAWSSA